jgi:hypothetical protein
MAINQTPIIPLTTNGASAVITVECHQGPGGSQIDSTSVLAVSASPAPSIATIAVTVLAGTVTPILPGTLALFVSESPTADKNLQVNVQVDLPPNLREIVYISHV